MDINEYVDQLNSVKIVSTLKRHLLLMLSASKRNDVLKAKQSTIRLEQSLELVRNLMCGNFFTESAKVIFDHFQLEREMVEQDVIGLFMANLDRLSICIGRHLIQIFEHLIHNFSYQTSRPMVEVLNRHEYLLQHTCRLLKHENDLISSMAEQILVQCCRYNVLSCKLIDMRDTNHSNLGTPAYIDLLHSMENSCNPCRMISKFRFLTALLQTHDEIAIYAVNRDLHQLTDAFNRLLMGKCHHLIRFKCLLLFSDLIQNRKLQKLLSSYTSNMDNFKLFYDWLLQLQPNANEFKQECIKTFEVFRLFLLNPNNLKNELFKTFCMENYLSLSSIIERAEKVRSYSDLALMFPEYNDVRERLMEMADKVDKTKTKARGGSRRLPSTISI
ncbi:hypothetical protein RDWZM_001349 [Blomia tropicalis]|uniref:Uncharacterized protein n=1 Tax=Blomia tropicalis TaxID=40697 RepID=A0A9Q0RQG9_BLOTA|nr:hypothetical protein RDWZM_001349 [Blomia tropicalis]